MAGAVTIVRLDVPRVVEADTTPVVLDCDFQVDEWERPGLVLKWWVLSGLLISSATPAVAGDFFAAEQKAVSGVRSCLSVKWNSATCLFTRVNFCYCRVINVVHKVTKEKIHPAAPGPYKVILLVGYILPASPL